MKTSVVQCQSGNCSAELRTCSQLLGNDSARSRCAQAQGWTRKGKNNTWNCPACTALYRLVPKSVPTPESICLQSHGVVAPWRDLPTPSHGSPAPSHGEGARQAESESAASTQPPPPPSGHPPVHAKAPPPPPPARPEATCQRQRPPPRVPMPVSQLLCESHACQKAFRRCEACARSRVYIERVTDAMEAALPDYLYRPGAEPRRDGCLSSAAEPDMGLLAEEIKQRVVAVVDAMNALPGHSYPAWAADCARTPVRVAAQAFQGQDSKNDAGSALVLLMLRPHLYGSGEHGWTPWWRLGFPPPSELALNLLDTNPIGDHRANVLEGLIEHWRQLGGSAETHCALLLEETWALLDTLIELHRTILDWSSEDVPSWAMLHAMLVLKLRRQLVD